MHSDEYWMRMALDLAVKGRFTASPNPCVGCVIVKDDRCIGQGFHLKAGQGHAEVNALKNATESVVGSTVYVTLEPCSHYGRTPPCAKTLVEAGVSRVVAAMLDPNPLVSGNGFKILKDAGIDVKYGVLEQEAENINKPFLWKMRKGLPYVRIKQAVSLDGKISLYNGKSKWITAEEARGDVQLYRSMASAILTTSKTVLADNPFMNIRKEQFPKELLDNYPQGLLRQPDLVILDSKAIVNPEMNVFRQEDRKVYVVVNRNTIIKHNYPDNTVVIRNESNEGSLEGVMRVLANTYLINDLWVEAGASLISSIIQQSLFNEYIVYMAPKLLGNYARDMNILGKYENLEEVPEFEFSSAQIVGKDLKLVFSAQR